jgi:hypothetical protein
MDTVEEEPRVQLDSKVDQLKVAAELTLRHFVEALLQVGGPGSVTAGQVRDLANAFEVEDGEIDHICGSVAAVSASDRSAWGVNQERRRDYLGRVLVDRFAPLLVPYDQALNVPGHFSRRVIPGFLHVVSAVLGMDGLKPYREACAAIADRMEAEAQTDEVVMGDASAAGFDWLAFFEDPEVMGIVDAVRIRIGGVFDDFEHRKNWFINVVQNTMAGLASAAQHTEVETFGEPEFFALMNALYADFQPRLSNGRNRTALAARFGDAAIDGLDLLCRNFETGPSS